MDDKKSAEYRDRQITISTCEYSRINGRMVVRAKQVAVAATRKKIYRRIVNFKQIFKTKFSAYF
jgi:hypothetical protein